MNKLPSFKIAVASGIKALILFSMGPKYRIPPMYENTTTSYLGVEHPWSLQFGRKGKDVILADWDKKKKKFVAGDRIQEVCLSWGSEETVHILCTEPDIDPEGDLNVEYIFNLALLDFEYINCEDDRLSIAWIGFKANPTDIRVKARLVKVLATLVKEYYALPLSAIVAQGDQGTAADPGGQLTATQRGKLKP